MIKEIDELEQMLKKGNCADAHEEFQERNAKLIPGYKKPPVGGLALAMAEVYKLMK